MSDYSKPYIWSVSKGYPAKGGVSYDWQGCEINRLMFMKGAPIEEKNYELNFDAKLDKFKFSAYDSHYIGFSSPIISERVLNVLHNICPQDFQSFNTIIRTADRQVVANYKLLNVIRVSDCIDKEASMCEYYNGKIIKDIHRLALRTADCMGGHHLVRDKHYPSHILLSPQLVKAFKKAKIKGFKAVTDEEAYPYISDAELFVRRFDEDIESAKRLFVSALNDEFDYRLFKKDLHTIPPHMLRKVIDITLSRSSFHKVQCEELLKLLAAQEGKK